MGANTEYISLDLIEKEEWDRIREGGGGGGSTLPDVTAADNGKLLGVNNGEWDKVDAPSGTLFVPFTVTKDAGTDDLVCSTTADFADAAAAVAAQTPVIAEVNFLGATTLFLPLANKVPATGTPTVVAFSRALDFAGSDEEPSPGLMNITWADGGAREIKIVPLSVAE